MPHTSKLPDYDEVFAHQGALKGKQKDSMIRSFSTCMFSPLRKNKIKTEILYMIESIFVI